MGEIMDEVGVYGSIIYGPVNPARDHRADLRACASAAPLWAHLKGHPHSTLPENLLAF